MFAQPADVAHRQNVEASSNMIKPSLAFLAPLLTRLQSSLDYESDHTNIADAVMAAVIEVAVAAGIDYEGDAHCRACFYTAVAVGDVSIVLTRC